MNDALERYEQQLLAAARRLADEGDTPAPVPRKRRRRRTGLALAIGVVVAGGSAVAATLHPWSPPLGDPKYPHQKPTTSVSPLPPEQLAILGVLRRPANAADRDPATAATLRWLGLDRRGVGTRGVHTDFIRRVGTRADGGAITLVPARAHRLAAALPTIEDPVCLIAADGDGASAAKACWSTADVEAGRARFELGHHMYGLVPDGVARVVATYEGGGERAVDVHDNFFDLPEPQDPHDPEPVGAQPEKLTWLAPDGHVVRTFTR